MNSNGEIRHRIRPGELVDALVVIGPIAGSWSAGLSTIIYALLLWPSVGSSAYALFMLCTFPPLTILSFIAVGLLIRFLLWTFAPTPPRPRHRNGRFAPILKNGVHNREYLVVVDKNTDNGR